MDLLGGYASSDSENEQSNISSEKKATPASVQAPSASGLSSAQETTAKKTQKASNRRGKKLLKLQAVLPEHIWNQLSNGAAASADDSDDEDDDVQAPGNATNASTTSRNGQEKSTSKTKRQPGDSSDLSNLLQALPKSKKGSLLGKNNTSILGHDSASTIISSKSSTSPTLGSAFVTSTVETVRTKKSAVRDIHGDSNPSAKLAVETVNDDSEVEEDAILKDNRATTAESLRHPVLKPSVRAAPAIPAVRSAAPPVASRYQHQPSYPTPAAAAAAQPSTQQFQKPAARGKRSRKRQMEQLLRQGNLDGVTSDVHLHGQDNVYQIPQDQGGSSHQSHGIRVVPTSQYNVGSGTTAASINISGKQRGKHQMNSLLASAASLEAARARNPQAQQTVHRANAKRKYGW